MGTAVETMARLGRGNTLAGDTTEQSFIKKKGLRKT
jgi:hypothetical protein